MKTTQRALMTAVSIAGTIVLANAPLASAAKPKVTVKGSKYGPAAFTVTRCSSGGPHDATFFGTAHGGFKLTVTASHGKGRIHIYGGNEQDSVNLAGPIKSLTIDDTRWVTAKGRFTSGGPPLGTFRLRGSCA